MLREDELLEFQRWKSQGYTGAKKYFWTSDWATEDAHAFQETIGALTFPLMIMPRNYVNPVMLNSTQWQSNHIDGWVLCATETKRFLVGRYLQLAIPTLDSDQSVSEKYHVASLTLLRLITHMDIAKDLVAEASIDFARMDEMWIHSASVGSAMRVEREGAFFYNSELSKAFLCTYNSSLGWKAARLFHLACREIDPSVRFVLMWSVLEATLGDGNKRRIFFETHYGDCISASVKKLHDLRNDFLHKASEVSEIKNSAAVFLHEVVRAAILHDSALLTLHKTRLSDLSRMFNAGTLPDYLDMPSTQLRIRMLGTESNNEEGA